MLLVSGLSWHMFQCRLVSYSLVHLACIRLLHIVHSKDDGYFIALSWLNFHFISGCCHTFGRFSYVSCDFTELKSFFSGMLKWARKKWSFLSIGTIAILIVKHAPFPSYMCYLLNKVKHFLKETSSEWASNINMNLTINMFKSTFF